MSKELKELKAPLSEEELLWLKEKREAEIAKKNKFFDSMTKEQRAVAIAKDVLKQLQAEMIVATQGEYIRLDDDDAEAFWEDGLALIPLEDIAEVQCNCCAIGASMLSFSRLFNRITIGSAQAHSINGDRKPLAGAFSWRTIALMEIAFERSTGGFLASCKIDSGEDIDVSHVDVLDAVEFAASDSEEVDEEAILRAIMQNIVDNEGEFKPRS